MFLPLLLLHIPALVAYLKTDHVQKDMYAVRKNACSVLREYITLAATSSTRLDHTAQLKRALEKCKATNDVASITYTSLMEMHHALNKKTPEIQRPLPHDACHNIPWKHETSFVRELFGMQLEHPALGITHPLVIDVRQQSRDKTLAQSIQDALGNATTITRAPLMLVCLMRPHTQYTLTLVFGRVEYTLFACATEDRVLVKHENTWQEHHGQGCRVVSQLQDIYTYKPHVVVYQRV